MAFSGHAHTKYGLVTPTYWVWFCLIPPLVCVDLLPDSMNVGVARFGHAHHTMGVASSDHALEMWVWSYLIGLAPPFLTVGVVFISHAQCGCGLSSSACSVWDLVCLARPSMCGCGLV